jgi:hypothetical protein
MAAGLGFKDFATGEVLTAADVDGYLMQGVWVFASATARDAAVTSPQEGNFAYLKDTNVTTYYTGSAWANLDTTGMTNPMTTTGDTIYSSSGSTPARLGIGTAGQVLQVNSGATAPEWATPAGGGGFTSLASGSLSGTSVVVSVTTTGYKELVVYMKDVTTTADWFPAIRLNGDGGTNYTNVFQYMTSATALATSAQTNGTEFYVDGLEATAADNFSVFTVYDPANSTTYKNCVFNVAGRGNANTFDVAQSGYGQWRNTAAITSVTFVPSTTYSTGTYEIYGVK